ncbi:type 1 glutamine amidotransferase domain-containing protein [Bacillus tianshenii]|nr:type 1 glutamine amidotransferase domain-containing protein [Bacillus tianshenii]
MSKRVLIVTTSESKINGKADKNTGLWLEEFAVPYNEFKNAGLDVDVVSISGGKVPLDPNSLPEEEQPEFNEAKEQLKNTPKLKVENLNDYDAIYLPGGHGTMFDFPQSETLTEVVSDFARKNKPIGAVCHGPSGLVNATLEDGASIVSGKQINGFTNSEEEGMKLTDEMPFLLESKLKEKGGQFVRGDDWTDFAVTDGLLVTGQNPMSSASVARQLVEVIIRQEAS